MKVGHAELIYCRCPMQKVIDLTLGISISMFPYSFLSVLTLQFRYYHVQWH